MTEPRSDRPAPLARALRAAVGFVVFGEVGMAPVDIGVDIPMTTGGERRAEAIIFMNRALTGMVTPELRGVVIRAGDNLVHARMTYEREPTEDDREPASEVGTEIIADDLPEVEVIVQADAVLPAVRPELRPEESWVYRRRETPGDDVTDQVRRPR